ncbi:MAG: SRPBCC family protein [Caldimonas sp.]
MWKTIGIVVAVLIAAVLAFAATRPDDFSVRRSIAIKAEPAKIYPLIVDFRHWPTWSPWEKLDPAMKRTLSGPPGRAGAIYEWDGSSKVGAGRMEVKDAVPPSKVLIQLDFLRPFEAHNVADFTLARRADMSTEVTWQMRGPAPFVSKLMGVFVDMDKMIGKDFETGLANLKAAAEK